MDDDEDTELAPLRDKITAMAYILWKEQSDLPQEIEDIIDDIISDVRRLIGKP